MNKPKGWTIYVDDDTPYMYGSFDELMRGLYRHYPSHISAIYRGTSDSNFQLIFTTTGGLRRELLSEYEWASLYGAGIR
jgi:hypothetical protein